MRSMQSSRARRDTRSTGPSPRCSSSAACRCRLAARAARTAGSRTVNRLRLRRNSRWRFSRMRAAASGLRAAASSRSLHSSSNHFVSISRIDAANCRQSAKADSVMFEREPESRGWTPRSTLRRRDQFEAVRVESGETRREWWMVEPERAWGCPASPASALRRIFHAPFRRKVDDLSRRNFRDQAPSPENSRTHGAGREKSLPEC